MHLQRCCCTTTSLTCEKVSCCLVRCQFKCSFSKFALNHRLVSNATTTGHLRLTILGKSNYFQRMTRQTNCLFQSMNEFKFFTFWKSFIHSKYIEFKTSPFMAVTSRSFSKSFIPLVANVVRVKAKHWQDKELVGNFHTNRNYHI